MVGGIIITYYIRIPSRVVHYIITPNPFKTRLLQQYYPFGQHWHFHCPIIIALLFHFDLEFSYFILFYFTFYLICTYYICFFFVIIYIINLMQI